MRTFTQKLAFLLLTLLCCVGVQVKANELLTVADGTATTGYLPIYGLYTDTEGTRGQCLYPADSLAEMSGGSISKLTFYSSATSSSWGATIKVSVGETDESSLASAFVSDNLTEVYSGVLDIASSVLEVEFASPLVYSGGNLIIDFEVTSAGDYSSKSFYGVNSNVSDLGRYEYVGYGSTSGSSLDFLPKVTFDYTPGAGGGTTCDGPETLDITDLGTTTATLNWSGGSGTYIVEYKLASADKWTTAVANTTTTQIILNDLTPNTSYKAQVKCVCGDNFSGYKTANFKTLIAIPYADALATQGDWTKMTGLFDPDGTTTLSSGGTWYFGARNNVLGGPHAYMNLYGTSCKYWIISPVLPLPAEADLQLSFSVALTKFNTANPIESFTAQQDDKFIALITVDDGATWNILRQWDNAGSEYVYNQIATAGEDVEIDLSDYAGQNVQIAFYGESTQSGGDNDIHVGNVLVDYTPTCLKPTDLHEIAGSASKNSVQIDWTPNTGEENWKVQYKKSSDSEWETVDAAAHPFSINGLEAFTEYDVRVAAACSDEDHSDYGKAIKVKTASGVPFHEGFSASTIPSDWKRYEGLLDQVQNSVPLVETEAGWNVAAKADANNVFPDSARHLLLNIVGDACKYWIVSPSIEMEAGYQLSFNLALTKKNGGPVTAGEQADDIFAVLVYTGTEWKELGKWASTGAGFAFDGINASAEGQVAKFDLSAYAGQNIQIAFYGESTETNGDNNLHISNVSIDLIPACSPATSLNIIDLETYSATALWTSDEDNASWQYGLIANPAEDFEPTDALFANTTDQLSVALADLSENTSYAFFLRKVCGEDHSDYIIRRFATHPSPKTVPWSENFNAAGFPEFWDNSEGTTTNATYRWNKYLVSEGDSCMRFNSYNNSNGITNILATPRIVLSDNAILSFRWKNPAGGAGEVLISNDEGITRTSIYSSLTGIASWTPIEIDLSAYTGSTVIIYFKGTSNYGYNDAYLYLDDVAVSAAPDCVKPTGLEVSEISTESAIFAWNDDADGNSWEYAVLRASEAEPEDEQFTPVSVNSVEVTGLTYNTAYTFYLRKACGTAFSENISIAFKTVNPYELTVNDGTSISNYVPFYGYYGDYGAHSQFIIPAETLAPIAWDTITDLTFYSSSASVSWGDDQFEIYMAEVPGTTLSALTDWTALTKVMNAGSLAVVDGKMEITLDAPFAYQGGNLLIGLRETEMGSYSSCSWYGVSAPSGSSVYQYSSYSASTLSFLPKTTFGFKIGQAPACTAPASLQAIDSLATTSSAVLVFTPKSAEENWVIRYKESGAEEWADTLFVANDTVEITGLNPSSAYEAQVASQCDPEDQTAIGAFSYSATFYTACGAVAAINENFDAITEIPSNANKLPVCWSFINTNTSSSHNYYPTILESTTFAHSGSNSLYFYSSAYASSNGPENQYAVLPEMTSVSDKRIKFYARPVASGSNDPCFAVGVMTDPADTSTFVPVYTRCGYLSEHAPFVIQLDSYTGEGKFIAIKLDAAAQGGDSFHGLYIDDVVVEDIPACLEPAALKADSIASDAVLLSWTPQGTEANWLVRYKIATAEEWADTILASVDTLLIQNLDAAATYVVQVAAWCDPADEEAVSPFSASYSFTTECGIIAAFPYTENFDELTLSSTYTPSERTLPLCWSAINTCTYSSYMYYPTAYYYSYTDYSNSQPNSLRFYSYYSSWSDYDAQDQYAILPQMEGINTLRMKFNARRYSSSNNGDSITVGIMTDPQDAATFVAIQTIKPAGSEYEPFEVRFNNYAGEGQYIAFKLEAATASTTSRGLYLDDVVVEEIPNCLEPAAPIVVDSLTTPNTVVLQWTAQNEETAWTIQYKKTDAEDWTTVSANANPFELTGLEASSLYDARIAAVCGETESSVYSAAIKFATACGVYSLPFAENFNALTSGIPVCWDNSEGTTTADSYKWSYYANSTDTCLIFDSYYNSNGNTNILATPAVVLENDAALSFRWKNPTGGAAEVLISKDGGLTRTSLVNNLTGLSSWTPYEFDLSEYTGDTVIFYFKGTSNYGSGDAYLYLDDVAVTPLPACGKVKNISVAEITAASAVLDWSSKASAWQIVYTADPDFSLADAEETDIHEVTVKPYALAELLTDTLYNVYVRANCGGDGFGEWSDLFTFRTAKSCQTPDDLAAVPGLNTAEISWNTYGQNGFNLRYIQGSDTVLVENVESPYEITGLQANTAYKVQVQAACEPDQWSATLNFKTAYGIPFEEKFATSSLPADWARYSGLLADVLDGEAVATTTSGWNFGTGNGVFDNHAKINIYGGNCKYWLATPAIHVSGDVQLTFDLALTVFTYGSSASPTAGAQADDKFAVMISTDNGNSWSVLRQWDNQGSEYVYDAISNDANGQPVAIDLSDYSGQAVKIAFYGESTESGGDNNLHIDNVLIDLVPTCLKPTALAVSDVFAHSAKLNWTAGDESQTAWQIALDTIAGFNPDTLSNLIEATENPYVLTGLDPETRYYAYVRANCGETDGVSRWSDVQTFRTTIACPAPTGLAAVLTPGNGSIATLTWNAGEAQAWTVEYSLNADLSDSIAAVVTEPTIDLTGLTAELTYYARVKADCGELDGESLYSAIISFKPTDEYLLTINDGTATNSYIPVYGWSVDEYTRSQFIIPAADLEEIMWDSIQQLTFYASNANITWGAAEFEVYISEVEEETVSAIGEYAVENRVMAAASLSVTDNKMVVTLDEPIQYLGGNLKIGFKQITLGSYVSVSWYGKTVNGASYSGYVSKNAANPETASLSSPGQRNFLPKMTITYIPGVEPACPNPRKLEISDITSVGATFSWKAVEGAVWEYAVAPAGEAEPDEYAATAEDSVVIGNLEEATAYTFYLRRACGVDGYSDVLTLDFETVEFAEAVSNSYYDDFEADKNWKFINSANAWVIGNATSNGGDRALYISNDGAAYAYDETTPAVSFATKLFNFERTGTFTVAFDWKDAGDFSVEDNRPFDYLRAAFAPADAVLSAGVQPEGLTHTLLPEGWIALDQDSALIGHETWQHIAAEAIIPNTGLYRLVFVWINDDDYSDGDPAAIDNLSIVLKSDDQTDIQSGAGIGNKAVKFIHNDRVYIMLNGNVYTVTGQKVELK